MVVVNVDRAILEASQSIISHDDADQAYEEFAHQVKTLVDFDWMSINVASDSSEFFIRGDPATVPHHCALDQR